MELQGPGALVESAVTHIDGFKLSQVAYDRQNTRSSGFIESNDQAEVKSELLMPREIWFVNTPDFQHTERSCRG